MIRLSYILTTFNKVEYLKVTLPYLIRACQADEEIVVVDGGSTDGTVEFLSLLKEQNKIHQFISEKDFGEAHGTNKAMLMAKGELVKIITDDDVFSFAIINDCKKFMLANAKIDIMGFDGFSHHFFKKDIAFNKSSYINGYRAWVKAKKPFLFCGLSFMIRKSSLPYVGLFNTKFKIIDLEYSLRISSMKTEIAFHRGLGFVAIANPNSNSVKFSKLLEQERKIVYSWYLPKRGIDLNISQAKAFSFLSEFRDILLPPKTMTVKNAYQQIVEQSIKLLQQQSSQQQILTSHDLVQ
ncbi:MAG: glycosyltransferase [Bacteroidetes bacterium]|nr:glycosyltransferase [Bacteroidota bacterium]MBS1540531.1 glycosyltransferase [Bacteroidota bacterium]